MPQDFLVELGTEELPPKALLSLVKAFAKGIENQLKANDLSFASVGYFATPRRLAVNVVGLDEATPQKEVAVWGPPAKVAFDSEGQPTKAGIAFAAKNSIPIEALAVENDGKVDKLIFREQAGGVQTTTLLEAIVTESLAKLPIPKRMRWGASRTEFVRPVHWLMMLFGSEIVEANILGLTANRETYGHRFHYSHVLEISSPENYLSMLEDVGYVIADFERRKQMIREQVDVQANAINGHAIIDDDLLNEVTALVEWPVALTGRFDERFLSVPQEALVMSMKEHQKYFHIVDAQQQLMPYFITVSNIESQDPAQVIDGNERVIRPRLADAAFFFETDKKTTLTVKRDKLKQIVFQAKLGTVFDKTERVATLAGLIADKLNLDSHEAQRAGMLCKSDLVSEMVSEFADMQGIAGYYYALNDGEPDTLAMAMNEQYLPRYAGDQLPSTDIGAVLALADRLDTLVGIFGIGEQPTGSKDPFALRRASVGVLRLIVEQQRNIDLRELLTWTYQQYSDLPEGESVIEHVLGYMLERFRAWYEEQGIPAAVFQAVSAKQLSHPLDIDQRVQAVNYFRQLPEAQALAAANKRVSNIITKQDIAITNKVSEDLLSLDAERALASGIKEQLTIVTPLFAERDYKQALTSLAGLRCVVDTFFDDVMVMVDDIDLRNNRLALLQQLRGLFLEVADISLLAVAKK